MAAKVSPIALLRVSTRTRRWVVIAAVLSAAGVTLTVAAGLLIGRIVGTVAAEHSPADLTPEFAWLIVVGIARAAIAWLRARLGDQVAIDIVSDLRRRAIESVALSDPRRVDTARWRTIITDGLAAFRPYLSGFLPAAIAVFFSTPASLAVIFFLDRSSGVIAAVTVPLIPIFMWLVGTLTAGRTERKLADMAVLTDQMLDLAAGLPTLTAHGRAEAPVGEVARLARNHKQSTMGVLRIAFLSSMVLEFLATLSVALVAVNIGFRLLGGHMTLAAGLAILIIVPEVYSPIRDVGARFHDAQNGATAASEVLALLAAPAASRGDQPGTPGGSGAALEPDAVPDITGTAVPGFTVTFDRFSVAGRDGEQPHNLTATALPGQITALHGDNGSGKSTAILGALGIVSGTGLASIRKNGEEIGGEELWKTTAYLPQRPILDVATVGDASALSLGQRQRRAFAEEVPGKTLLALDEPTAHLDEANARAMIEQLRAAADAGATVLVATHDPLLLAAADRRVLVEGVAE